MELAARQLAEQIITKTRFRTYLRQRATFLGRVERLPPVVTGGVLATSVSHRISASRLLAYGAAAFGAVDLLIFLYPVVYVALWPAVVGMIVAGLPSALAAAGLMTLLQRGVDDSFRGRLFGALGAVQGLAVLVGTVAAGYLGDHIGTIPVLVFQGGLWLIAGLAVVVPTRGADSLAPVSAHVAVDPL